jgi:prepilin-type N-terminal cleavage/methylation domain-containing protein
MTMRAPTLRLRARDDRGMTLVEIMVATAIFGTIIVIVASILTRAGHLHSETMRRVENQADARQTIDLMCTELRQAGADPGSTPIGLTALVSADSVSVHFRADLNADGTIETNEPSEDVTYRWNAANRNLVRNPGTGDAVLLAGVTNLRFSYFDAANQPLLAMPLSATDAALVHSVGLTLTTATRDSTPLTLSTRITLRNQ